jgi:hypothetical protein
MIVAESIVIGRQCFGDTQRQAVAFYNANPNIGHLEGHEWYCEPNFHVSFMTSNLVWFGSNNREHYLKFWKKNVERICQQKREDVPKYLKWLIDQKVIGMTKEVEEQMNEKFYDTAMQTLNMCPGFGVVYTINYTDAEKLDKQGKLKCVLVEKINAALKVAGLNTDKLLKKL